MDELSPPFLRFSQNWSRFESPGSLLCLLINGLSTSCMSLMAEVKFLSQFFKNKKDEDIHHVPAPFLLFPMPMCSGHNPRLNKSPPAAISVFCSPSPKSRQMCHWVIQCQKYHLLSHCGQRIRGFIWIMKQARKYVKGAELGYIGGTG